MWEKNSDRITAPVKVDVLFFYDSEADYAKPVQLIWQGIEYALGGVQFWYAEQRRGHQVHHYTLSDNEGLYTFELALETENLTWQLVRAVELQDKSARPVLSSFSGSMGRLAGMMG